MLPEERLFNIIQKGKNGSVDSPREPLKFARLKKKLENIKFFLKGLTSKIHLPKRKVQAAALVFTENMRQMELKAVNNIMVVVLIGFMILTLQQAVTYEPNVLKITAAISKIRPCPVKKRQVKIFETLDYYLNAVKTRNIFEPYSEKTVNLEAAPADLEELQERAQGLKLQGIAWGKTPMAMIKDEVEEKMYFVVHDGEIGATGVKVESIFENKVTISYGDAERELS